MRPKIIVLVGLPGSGKSTYVEKLGAPSLSSDAIRGLLADDPADQTIHGRVFRMLRYALKQRVEIGRPVTYVDATNLTPRERRPYVRLAEMHDCDIEAVFFDVPLETCLKRNSGRSRIVPNEAVLRMADKLVPPTVSEGFSKIRTVR